jgi:hypothetical protein
MNDDLDAIRRVLAADVESFRRLVERYQRLLLTLIRNLTAPDTDLEGVAQMVHVFSTYGSVRESGVYRWCHFRQLTNVSG